MERPSAAFTHSGKFHADDVFSTALLRIVFPHIPVSRGIAVPENFDGIVYDIGGGAFDHHGPRTELRPDGTPYAAFGLLWRALGPGLVGQEEADFFDRRFVAPLDLDDNTGCGHPLAEAIGSFNPGWDSDADETERFWQAEAVAEQLLRNNIDLILGDLRAKEVAEAAFDKAKDGIAVLPVYAPWKRFAKKRPRLQFVIYPSQRGGWGAQAVVDPADPDRALKCPFPAAWAGLRDEQAARISGIPTLRFCHHSRFLATADTFEDALAACYAAKRQAAVKLTPAAGFMPKAVITDCDGTIVSEALHTPAPETLAAFRQAQADGAAVIAATGRILAIIPDGLRKTADYLVCGNGALAADKEGRILYKDEWPREMVEDLAAFCHENGAAVSFYFEKDYGIYAGFDKFRDFYGAYVGRTDCLSFCEGQDRHLAEAPYGAFYIGPDGPLAEYIAAHPDLQAAPFMAGYYDIYKKTTNKAAMIGRVLEKAGIDWAETVAFGDGANDVEMLAAAGLACAMENGREAVKDAADLIVPGVSENGVAAALSAQRAAAIQYEKERE